MALNMPLVGIIPPMITPLLDRDVLDVAGLENLIEHILHGGVHGLFVLGTTGEAPSLSYRVRQDLIRRACAQVARRVPVLVGITDTSFAESINTAVQAADAGAAALVLAPPYYFPAGQPELLEYLEHLAAHLPLPLFLYNMPSHTKLFYEPTTVRAAADIPHIVGLKDSSANMVYLHKVKSLLADRPNFSLLVGPEELLAEAVLLGCHGGVNGGANLFPQLYVDLYDAAAAGDLPTTRALHAQVMRISNSLYTVGKFGSSIIKGIKCALNLKGICSDFMSEPFHRFRQEERRRIAEYMEQIDREFASLK